MRLLFVVPYVPNPVRVRPYEFIRALRRAGDSITLATVWTTDDEKRDIERLKALGVEILAQPMPAWRSATNSALALPSSTPLQSVYSWHPVQAQRTVDAAMSGKFDAVHVEHLRGSRYGVAILEAMTAAPTKRIPVVWDSVDCISYLFEQAAQSSSSLKGRMMTRLELGRTRKYEGTVLRRFDCTLVTSSVDKQALLQLATAYGVPSGALESPDDLVEVVPNGVDLNTFAFADCNGREPARIVFSGKMSYHANVTAAVHLVKEIMPQVWAQRPDAEVWIVGKDPTAEVSALATPSDGESRSRVVVTGAVPEMRSYIAGATIAVAPLLYGAGIQNKVLEAMACGTPVVATPQASQSLTAQPGVELMVAPDAVTFANALIELLQSPDRRMQMGLAGRAFVEREHSWTHAAEHLHTIYERCAARLRVAAAT
ncbi:MAG: glycosyltransferase [Anaerolineales bacterium]|nr:glycosyltransferase [Anaerolineales bacterium]